MGSGAGTRFGLRYSSCAHGTGTLVYGVMNRTYERIGYVTLIKATYRSVDFYEFGFFFERGHKIGNGFLEYQTGSSGFSHPRRTINNHMLRVRAALSRSQDRDAFLLSNDVAEGTGAT